MSRNRRSLSPALRFIPAVKAAVLCAFIGGSAIGYVWQKNQIIDLGRKIREKEHRLTELREANQKLSKQLITLRSPPYLARRARELNLNLVQPAQTQILRLMETTAGEAEPGKALLLAGPNAGTTPGAK
jgi:cell division protein FtsB